MYIQHYTVKTQNTNMKVFYLHFHRSLRSLCILTNDNLMSTASRRQKNKISREVGYHTLIMSIIFLTMLTYIMTMEELVQSHNSTLFIYDETMYTTRIKKRLLSFIIENKILTTY